MAIFPQPVSGLETGNGKKGTTKCSTFIIESTISASKFGHNNDDGTPKSPVVVSYGGIKPALAMIALCATWLSSSSLK
jgi:hypothetical protein